MMFKQKNTHVSHATFSFLCEKLGLYLHILQVQTQFLLRWIQNTLYMLLYYFFWGEIDRSLMWANTRAEFLWLDCFWVLWWCLWLAGFHHHHHLVNIKVLKMLPQRRCFNKSKQQPNTGLHSLPFFHAFHQGLQKQDQGP